MNRSSTLSLSYLPEVKRKKKSYLISSTVSAFNHMFPSKTPPTNPKSYSTSASVNDPSFSSCCVGFVISGFQVLHTINANVESEGPFTFTQSVKTGNVVLVGTGVRSINEGQGPRTRTSSELPVVL